MHNAESIGIDPTKVHNIMPMWNSSAFPNRERESRYAILPFTPPPAKDFVEFRASTSIYGYINRKYSDDTAIIGEFNGATELTLLTSLRMQNISADGGIFSGYEKSDAEVSGGPILWYDISGGLGGINCFSFFLGFNEAGVSQARVESSNNILALGEKASIAAVYKGGSHLYLFKNGNNVGTNTTSIADSLYDNRYKRLGSWRYSYSPAYHAPIDADMWYFYIFRQALNDSQVATFHETPYFLIQPRSIPVYFFPASGGGTTDELTAANIETTAPTIGATSIGQTHVLISSSVTAGPPVVAAPGIGQSHALTSSSVTASTPSIGAPDIGQTHVLSSDGITCGAPEIDAPTLSESTDMLTAADINAGQPTVGSPVMGQIHSLVSAGITTGAVAVGAPSIGQVHVLSSTPITSGAVAIGAPTLAQGIHNLNATGITAGVPELGSPTVGQIHSLVSAQIASGAVAVGQPTLGQVNALSADGITAGSPAIGSPTLAQGAHVLTAADITSGAPVLGTPTLGQIHALIAAGITAGLPVLGNPALDYSPDTIRMDTIYAKSIDYRFYAKSISFDTFYVKPTHY